MIELQRWSFVGKHKTAGESTCLSSSTLCRSAHLANRDRNGLALKNETFETDIFQVRQALGLVVVLLFVAGLLVLVGLVEWLEHYLETDLGYA